MKKPIITAFAVTSALLLSGCGGLGQTLSSAAGTIINGNRPDVMQATAQALNVPVEKVAFVDQYAGNDRVRTWQAEMTNGDAYTCYARPTIDSPLSNPWCQRFGPGAGG